MEFAIPRVKRKNLEKYSNKNKDVAFDFAKAIKEEIGDYLKLIVLFGSTVRGKETGDVDILLVLDDTAFKIDQAFVQTYRIIVQKTAARISKKLHITTFKLTSFWEYIRAGDPVAINIVRDGVALLDPGIFDPLQELLYQGRIRPTPESANVYFNKAPATMHNSKWHLLQATIDLYWAVIDAAQAALMKVNCVPPSPEHVSDLFEEKLVKTKLFDKKFTTTITRFYHISKGILHREITHMDGENYDQYLKECQEFLEKVEEFMKK